MGKKGYLIFLGAVAIIIHNSHGCEMDGISSWLLPQNLNILDTFRGEFFARETTSITGISNVVFTEGLNGGPYLEVVQNGSRFSVSTNDAYADYEEYETALSMSFTVIFSCAGGTVRSMVFLVDVTDTNNNDPLFTPNSVYEFTVIPPLPPGFQVTGCWNDIIARDIDLTTQRVEFEIYDSSYFEISYDADSSTVSKEFKASLKTTTFMRSIPEPIEFRISATDVDLTNDTQRTTNATVRIISDGQFELPEELVFSQTFYLATYTDDHQVVLQENISLRQGYHDDVEFNLDEESLQYFELIRDGNEITISVLTALPSDMLTQTQILLVVTAERNFTSEAGATVIIQMPEEEVLTFQQPLYEGAIVDNALQLSEIFLSQGYEGNTVTMEIISEYASYFSYTIQLNTIALTMTPLPLDVIEQNNFLNLQVVASTNRTSASTIVTLNIVKDDGVTPVFERPLYEGTYDTNDGLSLDQIVLMQGYDETVQINLQGEHAALFGIIRDGPNSNLSVTSSLPAEIFREINLLLTLEATKPRTVGATTVISIALPPETKLEFEQQHYTGVIEDNNLQPIQLVLSQGYDIDPVTVQIESGSTHASYFTATIQQNIVTLAMSPLPVDMIEQNNVLNLQVVVSTDRSSASAIVTLEIIKDDNMTPVFQRAVYEGTYDPIYQLTLDEIVLVQGYDETVQVTLHGDHASYFGIVQDGPNINLTISSLPNTLFREQTLLLSIEASKPRTVGANAAISIALPTDRELRFAAATYSGRIRDNTLDLDNIVMDIGYTSDVVFTLSGDYASYFNLSNAENQISVQLQEQLPEIAITENRFLLLTLGASAPNAIPTSTTIALEIIKDDITTPQFSQNIYFGDYIEPSNIEIPPIYLIQGFDNTVSFRLDGALAQYFGITNTGNNVILTIESTIPEQVIFEEKVLTFSVLAEKELTVGAVAAVSISFPTELTHPTSLSFSKNIYIGSLEQNSLILENIVLEHGFTTSTEFTLFGEYSTYFEMTFTDNVISISTANTLPLEVLNHKFISLELTAGGQRTVSVTTVIVLDIIQTNIVVPPVFSEAFYRGVYSEGSGLQFEGEITLSEGYDDTVAFELEGESAQWFNVSTNNNSITIYILNELPEQVLEITSHLLFSILARKPGATDGRAAISIDLPKEVTLPLLISFAQASYVGQIAEGSLVLPPVTLTGVYGVAIQFNLTGEFASYFSLTRESNAVTLNMYSALPSNVIEQNTFITLDIEASYPEAVSGYTTIVLELVRESDAQIVTPVFEQAYYIGQYSSGSGLLFEHTIQLIQGFDESVSFTLAGDDSSAFRLTQNGQNNFTLLVNENVNELPSDRLQFVFSVVATKPNSLPGRAAVVITLTETTSDQVLSFDSTSYVGTLENNTVSLDPILLNEGFTTDVSFTLHGDLATYFTIDTQGPSVLVGLQNSISEELIPSNKIILLEIRASASQVLSAFATIVLEVLLPDNPTPTLPEPIFAEVFYTGSYTATGGLVFDTSITLADGYDESIVFNLEGEQSQWFSFTQSENSVTLVVSSPLPPAVVANNSQLLFVIAAQTPGGATARATIVIILTDEVTADQLLGFDRINYVGSFLNDTVELDPIVLSEGYTSAVTFSLHGDLADFFTIVGQNSTLSVGIQSSIPQESIPSNGIILLEIQASAPQALSAFATIVLEVILPDDLLPTLPEPLFAEVFYTGSYTVTGGLVIDELITLTEGYHETIVFNLEGVQSQWFSYSQSENSVTLVLTTPIPPAVIANNQQLLFIITAYRPGGATARATIVILLPDEVTTEQILGFDRASYVGSFENDTVLLDPIILNEGFTSAVTFTLHGDLANYFKIDAQGAFVSITLQESIPEGSIPSNRIIILEIQASAPQTMSALATIILDVILADDVLPSLPEPIFEEAYYTGSYNGTVGLVMDSPITLADGYHESVVFSLEGEQSQWFTYYRSENLVTLVLTTPIPPAVIANNQQLLFVLTAYRPGGVTARTTIVILLSDEVSTKQILGFDRTSYVGSFVNDTVELDSIILTEGFTSAVTFTLYGDLANYFTIDTQGAIVSVGLQSSISQESIPSNMIILLEIVASAPEAIPAIATIVLEVILPEDLAPMLADPIFAEVFYTGTYTAAEGLILDTIITLADGYDDTIVFHLEGEQSQWFTYTQSENSISLALANPIPPAVVANNQQLLFIIAAHRPGGGTARATVVIILSDEVTREEILGFDRTSYVGSLENNTVQLEPIILSEGFTSAVTFTLHGDLASYFTINAQDANVFIEVQDYIPEGSLPSNRIILMEIQASAPQVMPTLATIVLEIILPDEILPTLPEPVFEEAYYTGSYTAIGGLVLDRPIILADGYHESIVFNLEGEQSQWFTYSRSENLVTLALASPIPPAVIANNQQLLFVISAYRPEGVTARATIVILLTDETTSDQVLGFDRTSYIGTFKNDTIHLDPIVLSEGFTSSVTFTLHGDLADYFTIDNQDAVISVRLQNSIPQESIPANGIILLEIVASAPLTVSAFATIVLEFIPTDLSPLQPEPVFDRVFYTGIYTAAGNLVFDTPMTLAEGYDETVLFSLDGDYAEYFMLIQSGNSVNMNNITPLPPSVIADNQKLLFVISAQRSNSNTARATVIIVLQRYSQGNSSFDKVLYEGIIQSGVVQHETIRVSEYEGNNIDIIGVYAALFRSTVLNGVVVVEAAEQWSLPADVFHVVLELRVENSGAVLVLAVSTTESPDLPAVSFNSSTYVLRVELGQTGLVGRVTASADNGEGVTYSLLVENEHLRSRISVSNAGELLLSAPANSGVYNFQIIATTLFSEATGSATAYLSVEALTVCGDNTVTAPLIVLDRDEEEAHQNLVVLNTTEREGCRFTLANRWPVDQTWLYVDETGLHATAIDREDPSIAFMALSQVQVELTLVCNSDVTRSKRSTNGRLDWLGPYDYGTSTWLLGETILYNPRRSIVNLIVNDINDNAPIFVGKENEPIVVGYPVPELEETVSPRSLAELQATDADIGENAALVYWSSEPELAVSPTTGFVHVRNDQNLEEDMILTVNATDLNGAGHTGSIALIVKLLTSNHIAVITIRDAFLEDESHILGNISNVIGYEVKSLRSVVVSQGQEEQGTRMKRDLRENNAGASLVVYAYGLVQREPVAIERLTDDINNAAVVTVNIASILSLEDHLESLAICDYSGRDTGLLAATIVLSILLFILIVAVIVWYILKRKKQNYEQFSDANSLTSQNESQSQSPKPLDVPIAKPRLNIEELKKSEKRLQDMLNAPIDDVKVEPSTSQDKTINSVTKIPDPKAPIVIQDKLKDALSESDDDEFGEQKRPRRKSVVTFNENVEKIIHVEESPDIIADPNFEVYKL